MCHVLYCLLSLLAVMLITSCGFASCSADMTVGHSKKTLVKDKLVQSKTCLEGVGKTFH